MIEQVEDLKLEIASLKAQMEILKHKRGPMRADYIIKLIADLQKRIFIYRDGLEEAHPELIKELQEKDKLLATQQKIIEGKEGIIKKMEAEFKSLLEEGIQ